MRFPSRCLISFGALLIACGSADSSFLTGGGAPIAGGGVPGGSGGGASGPGSGGFSFASGGGSAVPNGGAASTAGAANAAGGATYAAGGATQAAGGINQGGATQGAGGVPGGAGGARPAEGGAGSTLASLPTGGIVTADCATCAKAQCPNELTACDAEPPCRAAEACMTKCALVDCTSCILGAPIAFKQLFSDCLRLSCPNVCPGITGG